MSEYMIISRDEIMHQAKLACQIPLLVEGLISRKLIARRAEAEGVEVETDELQKIADVFRATHGLLDAKDTWAWLNKHGLSLDDFEEMIHTTVLSSKLANQLFADKVEPFFVQHQLNYSRAVIYEVVLDDDDLAMELFYALQEEELSFHEVAHEYIQEPELRRVGGYRGALRRADLKPEVAAAVFSATPPQILKPVITAKGTHLILVEEILQPELDETLRTQITAELFAEWTKGQIDRIEVKFASELKDKHSLKDSIKDKMAVPN
ncbi:peptidylprolyl isomerase [Phormidium tenue FACHB-886]|nr:peptidylprolyl isomerase [Phormidium tenue FACHB-886]